MYSHAWASRQTCYFLALSAEGGLEATMPNGNSRRSEKKKHKARFGLPQAICSYHLIIQLINETSACPEMDLQLFVGVVCNGGYSRVFLKMTMGLLSSFDVNYQAVAAFYGMNRTQINRQR